jgi:ribose transport system ATP-binding protein
VNLIAGKELATELKHHVQCCVDYGRPVLEGKNLSRPGCFRDISFTLYEREILGIYGMQGSGRTELLETIFGLAPEWSGELYCFGKPVRNANPSEAIRNGFAMVPENRRDSGIFPDMSIIENVNSANWREIRGVLGGLRMSVMRRICSDSMSSLNVKNSDQGKKIKQLSGGNQQKVVIAKWLATHPRILLVDEPTRGIDVGAKAEIFKIIKGLREEGLSVIIVSSELSEVISESDRILVMKNGSLVVTLTSEEVTRERIIQYAL